MGITFGKVSLREMCEVRDIYVITKHSADKNYRSEDYSVHVVGYSKVRIDVTNLAYEDGGMAHWFWCFKANEIDIDTIKNKFCKKVFDSDSEEENSDS